MVYYLYSLRIVKIIVYTCHINFQGWTDNDIFTKLHLEHKRYKRSSLALPIVKRDDDSKEKSTPDKETMKSSEVKLPDIKQTNSPKTKSQEERREESNSNGKEVKEDGSVTTVKEKVKSNKKKKFVKRLSNGEKIKRLVPEEDNVEDGNKGSENVRDGNQLTPEERILSVTGGIELVPLLARRRRVGARTLPSSDVTRPPDQLCQYVLPKVKQQKTILLCQNSQICTHMPLICEHPIVISQYAHLLFRCVLM